MYIFSLPVCQVQKRKSNLFWEQKQVYMSHDKRKEKFMTEKVIYCNGKQPQSKKTNSMITTNKCCGF
jgi:hypothetical protein